VTDLLARAAFYRPGNYPGAFLLEAESIPGPMCGRKDYVNENVQWNCRESNPRPSGFVRRAFTNCGTVFKCIEEAVLFYGARICIYSLFSLFLYEFINILSIFETI
jgi:hypothetical protein